MADEGTQNATVDVLLDISTPVLDFLEGALNLAPIPGLGLIPKALSAVVEQVKGARANAQSRTAFEAQVRLLSSVIEGTIAKAKATVNSDGVDKNSREGVASGIAQSAELQTGVEELKSTIQGLEEEAGKLKRGTGFRAFLKGFIRKSRDEEAISDMKDTLATAIQTFQVRAQLAVDQGVRQIQCLLNEAAKLTETRDDDAMINLIPRLPAGFDAPGVAHLKGEFLEGTRKALFEEELDPWLTGSFPEMAPKPIFFLSGGAGLGKSSIAHQLCSRLNDPQRSVRLGASYFFIRSDSSLASPALFFSTILHQLALSRPSLHSSIVTAVRKYTKHSDPQNMEAVSKDILRGSLLDESEAYHTLIFLVIDGLDECSDREILHQLLQALLELARAVPWLRVFLASRPEPHVMTVLTVADARELVHQRSLEDTSEDSAKDVGQYLTVSVSKMPEYAALLQEGSFDLARLVSRAGTSFLFARIALRFLNTYRDDPTEPLALLLQSHSGVGLEELDALYLQVLHSAYPPREMRLFPDRHARLLALLVILVLERETRTPALVAQLGAHLLQVDVFKTMVSEQYASHSSTTLSENQVSGTVDRLRSILLVGRDGAIAPIHATFTEFLADERRCSDRIYHVNEREGHAALMLAFLPSDTTSFDATTNFLAADDGSNCPPWLAHCFEGAASFSRERWSEVLRTLSRDLQLPMIMRYYKHHEYMHRHAPPGGDRMAKHFWIVKRSWVDVTTPDANELEFFKFAHYSILWWSIVLDPEYKERIQLTREHIAELINNQLGTAIEVFPGDMARYQAAHEQLSKMIDRDARTRALWYSQRFWLSQFVFW